MNKGGLQAQALEFAPDILQLQEAPPSPLPRFVMYAVLVLFAILLLWGYFGKLDVVAVAEGKLVPQSYLKIVQPSESGIIQEILVKEGAEVEAGQVLMRMDATLSTADNKTLQTELKQKELQLRRVEAELSGSPLKRLDDDPIPLFAPVEAQYSARRSAYQNALYQEQAVLAKAQQDLAAAEQIEDKLRQTLPHFQEQEQAFNRLVKDGAVTKMMAQEKQNERIEKEQDLRAQSHNVAGLKAAIEQSEKRIAQITSTYRKELQEERITALAEQGKLKQQWEKQRHRHGLLELKAPQAGIIKDLATHTQGTVVSPGTVLMTLVPKDEALQAEVWISNQDVGFIHSGQEVKVKLSAFPFQKYGMVEGKVLSLSADASDLRNQMQEQNSTQHSGMVPLAYRALVELKEQVLVSDKERYRLAPGMQVAAEIRLGDRTVMEYLLSPVQKAFHEAGRER
jgi:hemolysin D